MLTIFVSYCFFKVLLVWVFTVINTYSEMTWLVTSLLPFLPLNKHDTKPLKIKKKKKKKEEKTNEQVFQPLKKFEFFFVVLFLFFF